MMKEYIVRFQDMEEFYGFTRKISAKDFKSAKKLAEAYAEQRGCTTVEKLYCNDDMPATFIDTKSNDNELYMSLYGRINDNED